MNEIPCLYVYCKAKDESYYYYYYLKTKTI